MKVVPRGPAAFDRLHHDPRLTLGVIGRALAAMYDDLGATQAARAHAATPAESRGSTPSRGPALGHDADGSRQTSA